MINTDRISLFTLATGPRGSCKTLLMTSVECKVLLKSYLLKRLRGEEKKVWSNYPVGFNYRSPVEDGKIVHLVAQPLNMEAFYTFDEELACGWVFIDEIDQWYDRQDWSAVTQKLMNKVITQIRKKKLNLMATIQDERWLNARGQFQTDFVIGCREAAFTQYGRKYGLDLGECSYLTFKDKSGVMTGYTYEETNRSYIKKFWGRRFWNYYDTDYQFNPLETATKYKLKVPTKVIEVRNGNSLPDEVDSLDPLKSHAQDRNFVLLSHIVADLKERGIKGMKKTVFNDLVAHEGLSTTSRYFIEKHLRELKVGTVGREYTF